MSDLTPIADNYFVDAHALLRDYQRIRAALRHDDYLDCMPIGISVFVRNFVDFYRRDGAESYKPILQTIGKDVIDFECILQCLSTLKSERETYEKILSLGDSQEAVFQRFAAALISKFCDSKHRNIDNLIQCWGDVEGLVEDYVDRDKLSSMIASMKKAHPGFLDESEKLEH